MRNPTRQILDEHPSPAIAEEMDRVFQKALKFEIVEGQILGYCASCDDWWNQSKLGSPMCPKHKRFFSRHVRATRSFKP